MTFSCINMINGAKSYYLVVCKVYTKSMGYNSDWREPDLMLIILVEW